MAPPPHGELPFAFTNGIHVVEETYPLGQTAEALERLAKGGARFRVLLETGGTTR